MCTATVNSITFEEYKRNKCQTHEILFSFGLILTGNELLNLGVQNEGLR